MFNPYAPILSPQDTVKFKSDEKIRYNVVKAFKRMLAFYGLDFIESSRIVKTAANFDKKSDSWITPGNHNFLRITRILRSLSLVGFADLSAAFFECLEDIYKSHSATIGDVTFKYWKAASA